MTSHRDICAKGGRSVPKEKRTFSRDRELARSAGRKGGLSKRCRKQTKDGPCYKLKNHEDPCSGLYPF